MKKAIAPPRTIKMKEPPSDPPIMSPLSQSFNLPKMKSME